MAYTIKIQADVNGALSGIRQLRDEVGKVTGKVKEVQRETNEHMRSMGNGFSTLTNQLKTLFATYVGFQGVRSFLKLGADMEMLQMSFKQLIGSADRAKSLIAEMQQFAMKTPLTTMDVAQGVQKLMAGGVNVEKVMPLVKQISDISMGDRLRFDRLALAISQSASKGKLTGEEKRQMGEAFFNPLEAISRMTKKSIPELEDAMRRGELRFETLAKAIEFITSKGQRFYNMSIEGSKTTRGLWSNVVELFQNKMIVLFEKMAPTFKIALTAMINGLQNIGPLFDKIMILWKSFIETIKELKPIFSDTWDYIKIGVGAIYNGLLLLLWALRELEPILRVIVNLFIIWQGLKLFNTLIGSLETLKTLIYSIGAGLNSWTFPIFASAVLLTTMVDNAMRLMGKNWAQEEIDKLTNKLKANQYLESYWLNKAANANTIDKQVFEEKSVEFGKKRAEIGEQIKGLKEPGIIGTKNRLMAIMSDMTKLIPEFKTPKIEDENKTPAITAGAVDTSGLGTSGRLGQAKVINLYFQKELINVSVPNGNGTDIVNKAPTAAEMIIRVLNNISQEQHAII